MSATTLAVISLGSSALIISVFAAALFYAWNKGIEHGETKANLDHERADRIALQDQVDRSREALAKFADSSLGDRSDDTVLGVFDLQEDKAKTPAETDDSGPDTSTETTAAEFVEDQA